MPSKNWFFAVLGYTMLYAFLKSEFAKPLDRKILKEK